MIGLRHVRVLAWGRRQHVVLEGVSGERSAVLPACPLVPAVDPCAACPDRARCDHTAWLRGERPDPTGCPAGTGWAAASAAYAEATS